MKILGWILFLAVIAVGLVVYNIKYIPMQNEYIKIQNENLMWQSQVKEIEDRLRASESIAPVIYQVFLWDDLFASPASFSLTEPAQVMLKELMPRLRETTGDIIIAGHSDIDPVLSELRNLYPTNRELSFAKAMAVVNFLEAWGIDKARLVCIGYGQSRPADSSNTNEGRAKNRRVEIIVKAGAEPTIKTDSLTPLGL